MQEKMIKRYERKTKTPEQALASLMRLAARSEKSSGDALRLMRNWGVDPGEQQKVLDKLIKDKFIDDRRYADAYVREKTNLSGWGAYKIGRMLRTKGIGHEIIDEALGQFDTDMKRTKLVEMIGRKAEKTKAVDNYEIKGKLMRYGLSLGYEYDEVMQAVDAAMKNKMK